MKNTLVTQDGAQMQRFFAENMFDGETIKQNQMITVENGTIHSIESFQFPGDATQLSGLVVAVYYLIISQVSIL
jgi:hypothetical protein